MALLAVAGGVAPGDDLLILFQAVADEWRRGERALAAIRLAFAPVARLDEDHAYRLFLEVKSIGAARLIWQDFARDTARADFEKQISRQITGIRMEGKKRQLFVCVGSQENVDHLDAIYHEKYEELHFSACQ